jgi:multiple sugar transport system substrate-binding protein
MFSWLRTQIHINAFGGHYVDPQDDTLCMLGEPEAQDALDWLRARTWDDNTFPQLAQVEGEKYAGGNLFDTEKLATLEEGSWQLRSRVDRATFEWNVGAFVKGPEDHVTLSTTDAWSIWEGTKEPDAAWELIRFLAGQGFGRALCRYQLLQPSRKSNIEYWYQTLRREFPVMETVDLEVFGEAMERNLGRPMEIFRKQAETMEIINPIFDQVIGLGKEPVEAFIGACEEASEINRAPD